MKIIDEKLKDYAGHMRLLEALKKEMEEKKAEIINLLAVDGVAEYIGIEHKVSYKEVIRSTLDTKALRASVPDIANQYTKESKSMTFRVT